MARVSHLVVVRAGKEPLLTCLCLETAVVWLHGFAAEVEGGKQ